ncbi:ABC transporter permease [Blastochloris sulfoviridis]|uniref:ABC transporter permease subunit n=1 Tax=Blastochloris sulfoviridis TaxID=50712 RepID=A0A5M6I4P5_9HYPH|nr:ABC transporter permease subunit [Blastochloris sulfoviridis]KAA5603142.1 ABC transporter permease subunit [Blastochloris sulfoviridis]
MLRAAPPLTLALFLLPIAAGLAGTALPAFGYLPALGHTEVSLGAWRELMATPGLADTLALTLRVGLLATALSVVLAIGFCALAHERPWLRRCENALAPLLATPHAALAIGFAFLILPSGWLARLVSPDLTGWHTPPQIVTVRDPQGLSLAGGLVLKETPYLVLMILAASVQMRVRDLVASARALGYGPAAAWLFAVLPRLYAQIRLPVYAVLAFSLSAVDVALILAPGTPPPLAVLAMRWFADYDLALYPRAAAAALLQLALVAGAIVAWRLGEILTARLGRAIILRGWRAPAAEPVAAAAALGAVGTGVAAFAAIAGMALWSVAAGWRFPAALPEALTLDVWTRHLPEVGRPLEMTLAAGAAATVIALVLALACLENEQRAALRPGTGTLWLLYLPLLVPQIAFLFGVQVALVQAGLDGTLAAVIWAHLLFVLPYVFLSLADPFRALDPRFARSAAALGAGRARIFVRIKLPMLAKPILVAAAIGFAVSVGQYLPTLFAGAGRVATLTTEAVTLATGADRRILGVYAVLQAALPALVYGLALGLPRLMFRNRRGLA